MAGLNPLYPAPDKWRPGDNLLDNWYFVGGGSQLGWGHFPINQLGLTEYATAGYTINRWYCNCNEQYPMTIGNQGVMVLSNKGIFQKIETYKIDESKTYTASVLFSDNTLASCSVGFPQTGSKTVSLTRDGWRIRAYAKDKKEYYQIALYKWNGNTDLYICAIKLEEGPVQTLAHKEGGKWVLNRVPDYREELMKCQAYYRKGYKTFAVATSASFAFTEMEYNMRAVPLALLSILDKDNNPINAVLHEATANGCNTLYSATSEFTAGEAYRIEAELNANL